MTGARSSTASNSPCRACSTGPRPASTIVETYGCLCYHAGLLRNGVPTAADTHALHGEFPCLPMDSRGSPCGEDEKGAYLAATSLRDYAMGFGAHYRATPRVVLREDATSFDVVMEVENLSAAPRDLMYICHANFAFVEKGRIVQPAPFTPEHVVTRVAIPGHVRPNDDYRALLADLASNPARMERLSEAGPLRSEQVFYIKNLRVGADGRAHFLFQRPEGDGFTVAYDPRRTPHTIRWILANSDQRNLRLRDARHLRARGLRRRIAKNTCPHARRRRRVAFTTQLGTPTAPPPRRWRAKFPGGLNGSHRRDRQQHGRSRHLREPDAQARRDAGGAEFRDGARRQGRNQAVAAAKLGADVMMLTKVGDDMFADNTIRNLASLGIDTKHVTKVAGRSSGVAPIMVDANGENSILIVKGANNDLLPADIEAAARI